MIIPERKEDSHRKYEGCDIYLKKECRNGCKFYRKIGNTEYYGGGKHFQYLIEEQKLIRCQTRTLIKKGQIREHSVEYIDKILDFITAGGFIMKNARGGIGI
jgi:hypothetical protein